MNIVDKENVIKDTFNSPDFFLIKEYSFKPIDKKRNGKFVLYFINEEYKREVEIHFIPYNYKDEEHDLFIVYINKFPFKVASDTLSVEDYLRFKNFEGYTQIKEDNVKEHYKMRVSKNSFYLTNLKGDFNTRLKTFVVLLERIMDKYFSDILMGEKWEVIPFNWGAFK